MRTNGIQEDDRREDHGDEPRRDIALRPVNTDVTHAEHEYALHRDERMVACWEAQRPARQQTPNGKHQRAEPEAVGDGNVGRNDAELKLDREPRRAPNERGDDEERNRRLSEHASILTATVCINTPRIDRQSSRWTT